jgi:hypothetical protein
VFFLVGSSPSLKGLKIAMHASGQKRRENMREKWGETDLDTLQARQILPSDFSYGRVAYQLRTTTNFRANFCK